MQDARQIAPAGDPFAAHRAPSTRHHRCDYDFLDLLEEDFGISQFALRSAFLGVPAAPKKQAIQICEWAIRSTSGNTDDAGRAIRNWARKRNVGTFDPFLVGAYDEEAD